MQFARQQLSEALFGEKFTLGFCLPRPKHILVNYGDGRAELN
jgi:hypothetical protein